MAGETSIYQVAKDEVVGTFREGRYITTLAGRWRKFLATKVVDADDEEVQYVLQRATGNFEQGHERRVKRGRIRSAL